MIDRDFVVTEDELHAYVDGELPAERRGAVEAWLAAHPDDAARVAAWRSQAELIRARYGRRRRREDRRSGSVVARLARSRRRGVAGDGRRGRVCWLSSPAASPAGLRAAPRSPRRRT